MAGVVHFVVYLDIEHPTLTGDHGYDDDYGRVPASWSFSDMPEHADHRWGPTAGPPGVRGFDSAQDDQATWFAGPARRQRFVSSVREVVDAEGSQVISNEIFRPGPDRRAVVAAPLRPEDPPGLDSPWLRAAERPRGPRKGLDMIAAAIPCALCFSFGVVGVVTACTQRARLRTPSTSSTPTGLRASLRKTLKPVLGKHGGVRLAGACGGGALATVITRWPVAFPVWVIATLGLPSLFGQTSGALSVTKLEAIATWTEMLHSTLALVGGPESGDHGHGTHVARPHSSGDVGAGRQAPRSDVQQGCTDSVR